MPDVPDDPLLAMLLAAQETERKSSNDGADETLDSTCSHAWLIGQMIDAESIALRFGHYNAARHLAAALDCLASEPLSASSSERHGQPALTPPILNARANT